MIKKLFFYFTLLSIFYTASAQTTFPVNSQASFNSALSSASSGDTIEWEDGTYSNILMEINTSGITVKAETAGDVTFNGTSRTEINGDNVTFTGFQFIGGNILGGTQTVDQTVITIDGSNTLVSDINIYQYTCWKYLRIRDSSQNTEISYCNFEERPNYADQNILQVDVNSSQSGFHHIHHCSFKNFTGISTGGDDGVEPIRIGASSQATYSSKSVVEHCYFTSCEGDGEIISHKATDCVYRYNTFEGNTISELVLRHGDNGIVYGNFFINGGRGVRVREGSGHLIFNNYFGNLTSRSIYLVSSNSDPVDNITIAYNTIVDCQRFRLSDTPLDTGEVYPTNITILNNIFADPKSSSGLFRDATGNETWVGNIVDNSSNMGITLPASGITYTNPNLSLNSESLYEIGASSPAIDAATNDALFPFSTITGLTYDNTIAEDVIKSARPATETMKDIGCEEYNASTTLAPHVTADNTGPSYLMPTLSTNDIDLVVNNFNIYPNPNTNNNLNFSFNVKQHTTLKIDIYDVFGKKITTLVDADFQVGNHTFKSEANLNASGIYLLHVQLKNDKHVVIAETIKKLVKQ